MGCILGTYRFIAIGLLGFETGAQTAPNSIGHEQDRQSQNKTNNNPSNQCAAAFGERIQENRDQNCTKRWSRPMPCTTQDAHEHHSEGDIDVEGFTDRDIRDIKRMDAAHHAGQKTRQRKCSHFESKGWHTIHLRHVLIIVNRQQAQTHLGVKQGVCTKHTQ